MAGMTHIAAIRAQFASPRKRLVKFCTRRLRGDVWTWLAVLFRDTNDHFLSAA